LLQGAKKSGIVGKDLAKVDKVSKPPKGSTAMPRKRTEPHTGRRKQTKVGFQLGQTSDSLDVGPNCDLKTNCILDFQSSEVQNEKIVKY
jgi:hypothetical protein